jgi:hypothetical protein
MACENRRMTLSARTEHMILVRAFNHDSSTVFESQNTVCTLAIAPNSVLGLINTSRLKNDHHQNTRFIRSTKQLSMATLDTSIYPHATGAALTTAQEHSKGDVDKADLVLYSGEWLIYLTE